MKAAIILFDNFTDIDLFLMWDLFNRVRLPDWEVRIIGEKSHHVSTTGLMTATHGPVEEANQSDVVLFVSGRGTRTKMRDELWLSRFNLNPERQMIASVCSGALLLAALGLLAGIGGTAALSQILRRVLFGVSNLDPAGYLGGIAVLVVIATAAALVPGSRALRVDPMRTLRCD